MLRILARSVDLREICNRQVLLADLTVLLDASIGIMAEYRDLVCGLDVSVRSVTELTNHGKREAVPEFIREDLCHEPVRSRLAPLLQEQPVVTVTRPQLIKDAAWARHDRVQAHHRPAQIDKFLWSLRRLSDARSFHALGFYRKKHERPFSERDVLILHLLHGELNLDLPGAAEHQPADGLSIRERDVLQQMLAGLSEKEIAGRLGISHHTVHNHIKVIYRHFDVSSRAELMAHFVQSPDKPA